MGKKRTNDKADEDGINDITLISAGWTVSVKKKQLSNLNKNRTSPDLETYFDFMLTGAWKIVFNSGRFV